MARLVWRRVGASGDYPEWLRALDGRSGVYALRVGLVVRYVGESHSGALRKTITRHFQAWTRVEERWRPLLGRSSMDPGRTYSRDQVLVAFELTAPGEAIAAQRRWIARLRPADNLLERPDDDAVPF